MSAATIRYILGIWAAVALGYLVLSVLGRLGMGILRKDKSTEPAAKLTWPEKIEAIAWSVPLGYVIKWAVEGAWYTLWSTTRQMKDFYDRQFNHLDNGIHGLTGHWVPVLHGFLNKGQAAPAWEVTVRHFERNLLEGAIIGVVVTALLCKPARRRPQDISPLRLAAAPVLAPVYAIPGWLAGAGAVLALPVLLKAGWGIHGGSPLALTIDQFLTSGTLAGTIIGFLGAKMWATRASARPADYAQWWIADTFRPLFGPPGMRARVHALAGKPRAAVNTAAEKALFTGMTAFTVTMLGFAGYGFYLSYFGAIAHAAKL